MTRRILLIESLLSDDEAWSDASDSMRSEAIAMLTAVAEDFCRLPDTEPTLLLSPQSCRALRTARRLAGDVRVEETTIGPADWLDQHASQADAFDALMLIAPESDGVLVSLLQQIQSGSWSVVKCLNLDHRTAVTFSDKRATAEWLRNHRIDTPETKSIGDQRAFEYLYRRSGISEYCVVKPRFGAGSDRVSVISLGRSEFSRLREHESDLIASWVLQPLIPGDACSIGLIGGGTDRPTTVLATARQDIRRYGDQFKYFGGRISTGDPLAGAVRPVAEQIVAALGPFSGYLGIDLVASTAADGTATTSVIEINPRLCTSYIGYRALSADNLAACLLQRSDSENVRWKPGEVVFDTEGTVLRI